MSISGENISRIKTEKDLVSPNKYKRDSRIDRLKQIDAIYKSQIQQIYNLQNKTKEQMQIKTKEENKRFQDQDDKTTFGRKIRDLKSRNMKIGSIKFDDIQNISTSSRALHSVVSQQKIRSAKFINSDSSKTIDLLKIQNQNKQIKIRDLTTKCQYLLQKLRAFISANQFSNQVELLNGLAQNNIKRFENLFKIKNQESFFKLKLQIISLLQEFNISKQQLSQMNDIQTQSSLISYMSKKIKIQLKRFKQRQQQSQFQIQKDKILNQKFQQQITYLTQTNQLLKVSQKKLKEKNQNLKLQLHDFLQKLKQKQLLLEETESDVFRLKRQNQQLLISSNKTHNIEKRIKQQQQSLIQRFQIKQRQYKSMLNNNLIQKRRVQSQLQQKQCLISQLQIKEKYLTQQNQRVGRELLRLKQRYQWCQKQIQSKRRQFQQQKQDLMIEYKKYRQLNNQSILLNAKAETDQALHRIEQYQDAYMKVGMKLQQQKKSSQIKYQQYLNKLQLMEDTWLEKMKRLEQIHEQQQQQMTKQYEIKHQQLKREFQKKQRLVSQQMGGKLKALLAQKDRKMIQKVLILEQENEQLKKEIESMRQDDEKR